jgi:hypothetical protein
MDTAAQSSPPCHGTSDSTASVPRPEFAENDGKHNVTVDILVGSGVTKVKGITISGNRLSNAHYGVYTSNDSTNVNPKRNTFHNVEAKVKQT